MRYHWRQKREVADHIDDWLITYADMITLLLCFFVVFLFISLPKKNAQKVPDHSITAEAPKPPDILEGNLPFHGIARAQWADKGIFEATPEPRKDITVPVVNYPQLPGVTADDEKDDHVTAALANVVAPPPTVPEVSRQPEPASLRDIVDQLKSQGPANIEQKGDRITTLELDSAAFFARGSAVLSETGKNVLRRVAVNIGSVQYKDYQVTVEGHTDDAPISTAQFPSNWELSTARAAAVARFFLEQGMPATKLRAAGYADTFPVAPNRDAQGNPIPDNQARNRRVVITLEKIEKTE